MRLLDSVREQLGECDEALLCVAFASRGGVHLLSRQLRRLGPNSRLLVTNVFGSTTTEALVAAQDLGADVRILNLRGGTYHPKLYLSVSGASASATIGSANLTNGLVGNVGQLTVKLQARRRVMDRPGTTSTPGRRASTAQTAELRFTFRPSPDTR